MMNLPTQTKDKILKIIKTFLVSEESYQVFLFGSYATGKAHANSDIDIAIVGRKKLPLSSWQKLESALEESDLLERVDIVDFNRVSEDFQQVILKTGIEIS